MTGGKYASCTESAVHCRHCVTGLATGPVSRLGSSANGISGVVGRGEGLSKKEAEQQAAKNVFRELAEKKKNH